MKKIIMMNMNNRSTNMDRKPEIGDKIIYHYHAVSKDKKRTTKMEYFGFVTAVGRPGDTYTVVWWDGYGAQFSNREATVGKKHRQFELMP